MKKILLLVVCLAATLAAGAQDITKAAADSAYLREDYATAIQLYDSLLQTGEAAELYYNLAGSYYKSDDIARAILNYERALLLSPGNADIRANLEIARAKTVDKVIPVPQVFFVAWTRSLINLLSADQWGRIAIASFLLLLASLSLYFFTRRITLRKIGFAGGILFLLLVVFANIFAYRQKHALTRRDHAIVLTPSVTVTSTPSESGTGLFILHEGHKVQIKDNTMRQWTEIALDDGKVGWVPAASIEVI